MDDGMNIDRFVSDPNSLVELCREVIDRLDVSAGKVSVAEQQAQLNAIAKAVDQLEKSHIPVPDPLRAEKARLVAALAMQADAKQTLAQLADEFQDILTDLRNRLGVPPASAEHSSAKPVKKRTKLARTSPDVLRQLIIQCLKARGGRAKVSEVIADLEIQLEGKLLPGWQDHRLAQQYLLGTSANAPRRIAA